MKYILSLSPKSGFYLDKINHCQVIESGINLNRLEKKEKAMKFVADLHLHSKFSRATSRDMTLENMALWAKVKGISLLATGDFTHPEWFFLIKQKLEPQGNGFFKLKNLNFVPEDPLLRDFPVSREDASFLLSTELSFIYSKNGRVRKIHLLLLAPDLETAERLNRRLSTVGNLHSDGRPILGFDAKIFLKMALDISARSVVIPAHIWTPWFSLFGANSGFDSIEECFEELTPHIFALETGLSSDPPMNWRLSALDRYALVSNSDAHSPSRIGREANVFNTGYSYDNLIQALKSKDPEKFLFTVEFFPEEGKYHYDGHRQCGVVWPPAESWKHHNLCPQCGKKLTIGVLHRVEELADRSESDLKPPKIPYRHLIPLNEIIGEALGKSSECQSVWEIYFKFIREFGNEFKVLTEVPEDELARLQPEAVSQAISLMRQGKVMVSPGYDGTYGSIKVFSREKAPEPQEPQGQLPLF